MRLALALGEPNVDHMLRRMSGAQLTEWMSFALMEPFGEERADLRMAILAAQQANLHRDENVHPSPFDVSDFMPKFEADAPQISKEDAIAAIDAAMTALVMATKENPL